MRGLANRQRIVIGSAASILRIRFLEGFRVKNKLILSRFCGRLESLPQPVAC